jgi:hypothetical protein
LATRIGRHPVPEPAAEVLRIDTDAHEPNKGAVGRDRPRMMWGAGPSSLSTYRVASTGVVTFPCRSMSALERKASNTAPSSLRCSRRRKTAVMPPAAA